MVSFIALLYFMINVGPRILAQLFPKYFYPIPEADFVNRSKKSKENLATASLSSKDLILYGLVLEMKKMEEEKLESQSYNSFADINSQFERFRYRKDLFCSSLVLLKGEPKYAFKRYLTAFQENQALTYPVLRTNYIKLLNAYLSKDAVVVIYSEKERDIKFISSNFMENNRLDEFYQEHESYFKKLQFEKAIFIDSSINDCGREDRIVSEKIDRESYFYNVDDCIIIEP